MRISFFKSSAVMTPMRLVSVGLFLSHILPQSGPYISSAPPYMAPGTVANA